MGLFSILAKGTFGTARFGAEMASGNFAQRAMLGATIGGMYGYASSDMNNITNRLGDAGRGMMFGAMALGGVPSAAKLVGRGARAYGRNAVQQGKAMAHKEIYGSVRDTIGSRQFQKYMHNPQYARQFHKDVQARTPGSLGAFYKYHQSTLGKVGGVAANTAGFIANHPGMTLAATGVVGGSLLAANAVVDPGSPTMSGDTMRVNMNQQAAQQQAIFDQFGGGIAPQHRVMPMHRYKEMMHSTTGLVQGLHARRHA